VNLENILKASHTCIEDKVTGNTVRNCVLHCFVCKTQTTLFAVCSAYFGEFIKVTLTGDIMGKNEQHLR
jgi:hypothetical protein